MYCTIVVGAPYDHCLLRLESIGIPHFSTPAQMVNLDPPKVIQLWHFCSPRPGDIMRKNISILHYFEILWMEEILHQFVDNLSHDNPIFPHLPGEGC